MRILLVEDEQRLAEALEYILKKNGYGVDWAADGVCGQQMAESAIYDVIILDRMMPGQDGVILLRAIRKQNIKTPVLFLTAKDSVENKVEGLDAGADDYLVKPFSTEELLARIRALGRRPTNELQSEQLQLAGITLMPKQCEVSDGITTLKLSLKESLLLELFMRNRGLVLTKEQILDRVWGLDAAVELNNIEIHVHHLRKKLSTMNSNVKIDTIRGIGYCLKENSHV